MPFVTWEEGSLSWDAAAEEVPLPAETAGSRAGQHGPEAHKALTAGFGAAVAVRAVFSAAMRAASDRAGPLLPPRARRSWHIALGICVRAVASCVRGCMPTLMDLS